MLTVASELVDENIAVISKYLKWAEMAKQRGDLLDKDIEVVKGFDVGPFFLWNSYKFHSGNPQSHYLIVTPQTKMLGFFKDQKDAIPFVLDEENAAALIKRLAEFRDGKISVTKTDDYK